MVEYIAEHLVGITIFVFLLVLGLNFVQPFLEASAFNHCTGGNAGYWDAAFTELRVTECKK
jgi:hypothetical protein